MSTEKELLQLIKNSDKKAFELIFRLYYQPLKQFASKILNDTELAEDIVQEVFVQFWETRTNMSIVSLKSYLYTIVKNKCLNQLRHLKVRKIHHEEIIYTTEKFFDNDEKDSSLKIKLLTSIDKLPAQCKKIFIMSRMHRLKHKEIAEELGISVKTVKNQVGKALKLLREDLTGINTALIISIIKLF